ncbi:MAG TPA: hypothetical protein VHO49_18445 [Anaerolineales bacterium]|nr:hypothetical protein [Anaerolineales bacterium]
MITNHERPRWSFYATWILLTSLSIPIAFFLTLIVLRIITRVVGDVIYVDGVRHITEDYLWIYPFIPIVGLLTGGLQYGLLRRYLPRMGGWVLATAGGWLLGVLLIALPGRENLINEFLGMSLVFLLMGLSIGVGQWLILRQRLAHAGWWIAANLLGWGLLGLIRADSTLDQFSLFVIGLLPACVTALVLALLMKGDPTAQPQTV